MEKGNKLSVIANSEHHNNQMIYDCWAVRDVTHVRQFVNTREQQPQISHDSLTTKELTAQYGQSYVKWSYSVYTSEVHMASSYVCIMPLN